MQLSPQRPFFNEKSIIEHAKMGRIGDAVKMGCSELHALIEHHGETNIIKYEPILFAEIKHASNNL